MYMYMPIYFISFRHDGSIITRCCTTLYSTLEWQVEDTAWLWPHNLFLFLSLSFSFSLSPYSTTLSTLIIILSSPVIPYGIQGQPSMVTSKRSLSFHQYQPLIGGVIWSAPILFLSLIRCRMMCGYLAMSGSEWAGSSEGEGGDGEERHYRPRYDVKLCTLESSHQ